MPRPAWGWDRVRALENGVALDMFNPASDFQPLTDEERGSGPLIVFTGQMGYPNVEAVAAALRMTACQSSVPSIPMHASLLSGAVRCLRWKLWPTFPASL